MSHKRCPKCNRTDCITRGGEACELAAQLEEWREKHAEQARLNVALVSQNAKLISRNTALGDEWKARLEVQLAKVPKLLAVVEAATAMRKQGTTTNWDAGRPSPAALRFDAALAALEGERGGGG